MCSAMRLARDRREMGGRSSYGVLCVAHDIVRAWTWKRRFGNSPVFESVRLGCCLQRAQKLQQLAAFLIAGAAVPLTALLCLTAMPQDRLFEAFGAAVVQEAQVAVDGGLQAEAPERWGAPFVGGGSVGVAMVGQGFAEVVQQEVGVGVDGLMVERGDR